MAWGQQIITTTEANTNSVFAADLDGDGDVDVLSASAAKVSLYENTDGLGLFGRQQVIATATDVVTARSVLAASLDADGDLDVLSASGNGLGFVTGFEKIAWYKNLSCPAPLPAAEIVRLGSPPNPAALLPGVTSGPIVSATWDPVIDHSTFLPSATRDFIGISATAINVPTSFGTLLCALPARSLTFLGFGGLPFNIPIPGDCNLVGVSLCAQGASGVGGTIVLTNALDITIGTF